MILTKPQDISKFMLIPTMTAFERLSFATYDAASKRYSQSSDNSVRLHSERNLNVSKLERTFFDLYSFKNIAPVISSGLSVLGIILSPYLSWPLAARLFYNYYGGQSPSMSTPAYLGMLNAPPLVSTVLFGVCLANILVYYMWCPPSHVTGAEGLNSVGASTVPGLYHCKSAHMLRLLQRCPLLTTQAAVEGHLPGAWRCSSPWMFSGDLRTLFPFLFFYPIQVKYVRRWVRVPLADGPFDSMAHTDAEAEAATAAMVLKRRGQVYVSKVKPEPESTADPTPADDRMKDDVASPLESDQQLPPKQAPSPSQLSANDGCYEAVAVDYSPGIKGRSSTKTATTDVSGATATTAAATAEPDKFALLILAGLTGGSSEGYVMDLVNAANRRGVDCYVMLGRGLAGVPNRSAAAFHGARTSDMRETARVIRRSLHPDTKLLAVGISMGGIIVTNAVARGDLLGLVDGAVSVCGCFDSARIVNYAHSRHVWQPLLTHGLKAAFVAPEGALEKMTPRVGPTIVATAAVAEDLKDMFDFDSSIVAPLHRFRELHHYYADMCGATETRLLSLVSRNRLRRGYAELQKQKQTQTQSDSSSAYLIVNEDSSPAPAVDLDLVLRDSAEEKKEQREQESQLPNTTAIQDETVEVEVVGLHGNIDSDGDSLGDQCMHTVADGSVTTDTASNTAASSSKNSVVIDDSSKDNNGDIDSDSDVEVLLVGEKDVVRSASLGAIDSDNDNDKQSDGWVEVPVPVSVQSVSMQSVSAVPSSTLCSSDATTAEDPVVVAMSATDNKLTNRDNSTTEITEASPASGSGCPDSVDVDACDDSVSDCVSAYEDAAHDGLCVPLLALHAADDPIIHVDSMPCRSGAAGAVDNLVCLVTRVGGHVGWPQGWAPWIHRWSFQNNLALEFCEAVASELAEREGKERRRKR